jgi:hypothetical protein
VTEANVTSTSELKRLIVTGEPAGVFGSTSIVAVASFESRPAGSTA